MSRAFGPIWLLVSSAALCGCLGDLPPFQGGDGGASSTATGATSTATIATATSSGEGGGPSTATGTGGSDPGPTSTASTGAGDPCGLDRIPEACPEALDALTCAGLVHREDCVEPSCPDEGCALPASIALRTPANGYCTSVVDSVEEICLSCDEMGPGIALATPEPTGPLVIGSFEPGMRSFATIRARGVGRFTLEWWQDSLDFGSSELHVLGPDFANFDVALASSGSFELRVVPDGGTFESEPLWMELDCAYTTYLASGAR